jgi:hypothetical protein
MFHDRRQRNRERLRDVAHGHPILLGEPRENRAPGRVRQSREGGIQFVVSIVNHMVKYMCAISPVKEKVSGVSESGKGRGKGSVNAALGHL